MDTIKKEKEKKFDFKWIVIIILVIAIIVLGVSKCQYEQEVNPRETVIKAPSDEPLTEEGSESIRIRINTYLTIEDGKVTNLNFSNLNAGQLMDVTIVTGDKTIYKSSKIGEGEIIESARIKTGYLEYGENKATAQICYYKADGTYEGQTDFEIKIIYI